MPIRLDGLTLTLTGSEKSLRRRIAARLGVPSGRVVSYAIRRKSLDVRDQRRIRFVYSLDVVMNDEAEVLRRLHDDPHIRPVLETQIPFAPPRLERLRRPVIVGAGPAGLFAAETLARRGASPLILERGQPVDRRHQDVGLLLKEGRLNPESNICYGEGGAGAYSDGKLTTRSTDPLVQHVLKTLVELGAPGNILYDAAPHLGSDRLPIYIAAFRQRLEEQGAEFRFGARVVDVVIEDSCLQGLVLADGGQLETDLVLLAAGHSAADLVHTLHRRGVAVEPKGFAVGLRIEHPQAGIDKMQYGRAAGHAKLPPATYRITYRATGGRGVYSFCMCPGGMILPSSTDPGHLVVNGGSNAARDGGLANAALVVTVSPDDFGEQPLDGLKFRETLEAAALVGGAEAPLRAPAQRVTDFLAGKESTSLPETSYRPGLMAANLRDLLPPFVAGALHEALTHWKGKLRGFIAPDAVLIGVETRTSSPWRLVRNERCESVNTAGLLVAGEGAGYAGGIVTSAVDGIKAALAIK